MAYKKLKYWFDKALATRLAEKIEPNLKNFSAQRFIEDIGAGISGLELSARVELFADTLREHLPGEYPKALGILMEILGPENEQETGMFTEGYWLMPVAKFVEKYGLDHFAESIDAIQEITKRNTGEYCIRPFLERYPEKTLAVMQAWSLDENVHVRRLASEGIRPRLPWAKKLDQFIADPRPVLPILENLKDDKSMFVRKSVANNLNDILKDNYQIGMKILISWSKDAPPDRRWIIKHALRNQIKRGNTEAIRLVEGM